MPAESWYGSISVPDVWHSLLMPPISASSLPQTRQEANPLSGGHLSKTPLLCLGYLGPAAVTSHSSCNCSHYS